jgi:DNA segregation ATPase FtsK/SpoIIIE, S-DNA-T family
MSNTSNRNNRNDNQSSDDDWIGEPIWALVKAAGQLLWWAVLFPALSIPVILTIWVAIAHGPRAGLLTAALAAAAYIGWAVVEPSSFTAWVTASVRQRWLSWWRYHRNWESVCTLHGLTARLGDRTLVPALRSVQIGDHADMLIVGWWLASQSPIGTNAVRRWRRRGGPIG